MIHENRSARGDKFKLLSRQMKNSSRSDFPTHSGLTVPLSCNFSFMMLNSAARRRGKERGS